MCSLAYRHKLLFQPKLYKQVLKLNAVLCKFQKYKMHLIVRILSCWLTLIQEKFTYQEHIFQTLQAVTRTAFCWCFFHTIVFIISSSLWGKKVIFLSRQCSKYRNQFYAIRTSLQHGWMLCKNIIYNKVCKT